MKERSIRVPAGGTTIETPLLAESGLTYIISVHWLQLVKARGTQPSIGVG